MILRTHKSVAILQLLMGKAAAKRTTTTDPVDEKISQASKALAAQQFMGASLNMGWRLAITVVVPIVAGVKIDDHFHTSPSYTLVGVMLAAVAGSVAVWSTIKQVNKEQADEEASEEKQVKRKRKDKA